MRSDVVTKRVIVLTNQELRIAIRKWVEETHQPIIVFTDGWNLKFTPASEAIIDFEILTEGGQTTDEPGLKIKELIQGGPEEFDEDD